MVQHALKDEGTLEGRGVVDCFDGGGRAGDEFDDGPDEAGGVIGGGVGEEEGFGAERFEGGGVVLKEVGADGEGVDKVGGAARDTGVVERVEELVAWWVTKVAVSACSERVKRDQ